MKYAETVDMERRGWSHHCPVPQPDSKAWRPYPGDKRAHRWVCPECGGTWQGWKPGQAP